MSTFTGGLRIEEIVPGKLWQLLEPIRYEAGREGSDLVITVPAGFVTDGATIRPPALRVFLAVWGTYGRASALHDYLYSILRAGDLWSVNSQSGADILHPAFAGGGFEPGGCAMIESYPRARAFADREFHRACLACGTSRPLAWLLWAMVRMFGAKAALRETAV